MQTYILQIPTCPVRLMAQSRVPKGSFSKLTQPCNALSTVFVAVCLSRRIHHLFMVSDALDYQRGECHLSSHDVKDARQQSIGTFEQCIAGRVHPNILLRTLHWHKLLGIFKGMRCLLQIDPTKENKKRVSTSPAPFHDQMHSFNRTKTLPCQVLKSTLHLRKIFLLSKVL